MIEVNTIADFSGDTPEGKMLLAAVAILTSIEPIDIKENKFGGMSHVDNVIKQIAELANKIYYEEEYKQHKKTLKRDNKINEILDEPKQNINPT